MDNTAYMNKLLQPYGPQLPIDRLVEEINGLYHSFEAPQYDISHPEIRQQLPTIWASMIEAVNSSRPTEGWDVLDFGCGTGFATEQVLSRIPSQCLRTVTCYDPSPEMVNRCQKRLAEKFSRIQTTSRLEDITASPNKFNLLITNSVLHHLPDPIRTIDEISVKLSGDAIWICGHEPSSRFYHNDACLELLRVYEEKRRWRRLFTPQSYLKRLARFCGFMTDPAGQAARAAHQQGLFHRRPSRSVVSRLVDFHVAHSIQEVENGRGFDVRKLQNALKPGWSLEWHQSYNFLGSIWQSSAGTAWETRCKELERQFPDDGANFCSVWGRTAQATKAAA